MDSAYLYLAASLLPLAIAPWAARLADRSAAATSGLDSFVAVTVSGVALFHVLPHTFLEAGLWTLPAMAFGFVLPLGLGHSHSPRRERARSALILIAFLGLGLHAALDGLALFAPHAEPHSGHGAASGSLLALAVVLHRLPMALAIWWIAAPSLGPRIAAGLLGTIGVATVGGFVVAGEIWGGLSSPTFAVLQAAIAGMLLHMVLGHHEHRTAAMEAASARLASTLGVVAGAGLIAAMTRLHPLEHPLAGELSVSAAFRTLAVASAPALLLAYFGLALLRGYAPAGVQRWLLVSRSEPSILRRVLTPEIQLPVVALSLCLLGAGVTLYWLLSVLAVGGLAVLTVRPLSPLAPLSSPPLTPTRERGEISEETPARGRKAGTLRFAFGTEIERTMPWILIGLGIAAFLEPMTDLAFLLALAKPAQIGVAALLGVLSAFLGPGTAPIAAVLIHKGLGLGPVLVFLLAAVTVGGKRRLAAVFGSRLAWSFAVRMAVLTLIWGYALDVPVAVPDLHAMADRPPGVLALASAFVLLGLTLAALLRQGFRGFLRPSQAVERWHEAGL